MWELGGWVTPKVADAGGAVIYCCSQFIGADANVFGSHYAVMPVLTKKTVERTAMVEDC